MASTRLSKGLMKWLVLGTTLLLLTGCPISSLSPNVSNNPISRTGTGSNEPSTGTGAAVQQVTITSITPSAGSVGTVVKISGTGFGATPGENVVKFNGTAATVSSASSTSLSVIVPSGATTGTVSVTANAYTGTSSSSFTVTKMVSSGTIYTIAGTSTPVDGTIATNWAFREPGSIVSDSSGNLFTSWNNTVLKIDTTGIITTVAGNGTQGFSGDGGLATNAQLKGPGGLSFDSSGNLYVADRANHRIRRIDTSGIITTVAGNGTFGFSGDGGQATSAQLNGPIDVAVDKSGNLYIADLYNFRIRKVALDGIITTVAGNGTQAFSGDGGPATSASLSWVGSIAIDVLGNIFVIDFDSHRIRKIDTSGIITTVAGNGTAGFSGDGGLATNAQIGGPRELAFDSSGNLLIADKYQIRKVDSSGIITTVAGNGTAGFSGDGGPATYAQISDLSGLAVDSADNIYVSDRNNHRIRKINTSGVITTVAGNGSWGLSGDGGQATNAQLDTDIRRVAIDPSGNLLIADIYRIRKIDTSGIITTVAGTGKEGFSGDGGVATNAQFAIIYGISTDGLGNIYVADVGNKRIRKIDTSGIITTVAGGGISLADNVPATSAQMFPYDVEVDGQGNLFIADYTTSTIRKVDTSGIITTVAGNGTRGFSGDGGPAKEAQISYPRCIALDSSGNLYIGQELNPRIRKVDASGIITTVAGNGTIGFSGDGGPAISTKLSNIEDIAVDGLGNLFVSEGDYDLIRKVDTSGIITTVAGNGTRGFSGDGGPATKAVLFAPRGVLVDDAGNLLIVDCGNGRIRKVQN